MVTIPIEVYNKLKRACDCENRSISNLLSFIIYSYLEKKSL